MLGLFTGAVFSLCLSSCEPVKEEPGQIKYPVGAQVGFGDNDNEIIVTTTELGAKLVDCGRVDKSILGFRLPIELGGHDVKQSKPVKNTTESPGHVDVTCTDNIISHFTRVPVEGYLRTVTVTLPNEQPSSTVSR